jgi:hypothetical protein
MKKTKPDEISMNDLDELIEWIKTERTVPMRKMIEIALEELKRKRNE